MFGADRRRSGLSTIMMVCIAIVVMCTACSGVRRSTEGQDEPPPDDGLERTWRLRNDQLDVLVVIDTATMLPEAREVAAERIGEVIESIIRLPEDQDCSYCVPYEDVHVGIVEARGDGRMTLGNGICSPTSQATDCESGECRYLSHINRLTPDGCEQMRSPLIPDLQCIVNNTTNHSQANGPLDAMLRALSVHAEQGGTNEGFLRERSVAFVLFVTAGDDTLQETSRLLPPVDEYVEALEALHPDWPARIGVGLVAGLPTDWRTWTVGDSLAGLEQLEGSFVCESGLFHAIAPSRLMQFLYAYGNQGTATSICEDDWNFVLSGLMSYILPGIVYQPPCPMATLYEAGPCRLIESLPDGEPCPQDIERTEGRSCGPGWHRDLGLDDQGRRQCEFLPSDRDGDGHPDLLAGNPPESCVVGNDSVDTSGCVPGWYYLPYDTHAGDDFYGSVVFTWGSPEVRMSPRAVLRLECDPTLCE